MDNPQILLKWDDALLTGIEEIDLQHQHFVGILNRLYVDFSNLAPKENLDKSVSELISYATTHFATEEGYMEKYKFPGIEEHKEKHRELTNNLNELVAKYNNEGKSVLTNLFDFLENWLVQHLDLMDSKYVKYFKEIGVLK